MKSQYKNHFLLILICIAVTGLFVSCTEYSSKYSEKEAMTNICDCNETYMSKMDSIELRTKSESFVNTKNKRDAAGVELYHCLKLISRPVSTAKGGSDLKIGIAKKCQL